MLVHVHVVVLIDIMDKTLTINVQCLLQLLTVHLRSNARFLPWMVCG